MLIQQYIYRKEGAGNLQPETLYEFDRGAYRIAFQALPGTEFEIEGNSEGVTIDQLNQNLQGNKTLIMGHTGIYELGFSVPIIKSFKITKTVDTNTIMILDVLVNGDEAISSQRNALTAQDFDYLEEVYSGTNTSLAASLSNIWEGSGNNE